MGARRSPSRAFHYLIFVLAAIQQALSNPLGEPLNTDVLNSENGTIAARCANPCGYYGQLCCQSGESCLTDANNQAQCGPAGGSGGGAQTTAAPGGSGYWQYYTSTWIETQAVTKTSVYSSWIGGAATATAHPTQPVVQSTAVPANCQWDKGESSCGNICCPSGQYCQVSGQCAAAGSVSAPLRPTSSGTGIVTQTSSVSTTTTVPFGSPIATGQSMSLTQSSASSSSGLSGGAIAGIVIGVILGIIILILLCLCLCFKAAWDGLLALFGLGKRRRSRKEVIEYESYHRSGGGAGRRTWYGGKPSRVGSRREDFREKRTTGTRTGAGFGGLMATLGFKGKRDERRRREEERSDLSSTDYSYSDYTASSDRRTRDTRRSMSRR